MSGVGLLKMKTCVYRCPDDVKNFRISVKLKKLHSSVLSSGADSDLNSAEKETKKFSWQEKVFSPSELEFYSKENNCVTDLDKHYHEIICKNPQQPGRIFSYVQADEFYLNEENITTEMKPRMSQLYKKMSNLRLRKTTKVSRKDVNSGYEINKFLNNSITNPFTANSYETMFIMADLGNNESDSNIWLKSEHVLSIIKYDAQEKILMIYPDFSANENEPYSLEIDSDGKFFYEYTVENISLEKNLLVLVKENDILRKLNERNQEMRSQILEKDFLTPPRGVFRVYLFFEILSAKNFEYDNIYIQYSIDLPENWSCTDEKELYGTTQCCQTKENENFAHFGYYFELCLEYKNEEDKNSGEIPNLPTIYFEVISRDFWDRYRTEGICYKCIPVFQPGIHNFQLQCIRVCSKNPRGELRRYFVGDYSNLDDISWFGIPKNHEGNVINKYGVRTIGTGTIEVRLNIVNQSNAFKSTSLSGTNASEQTVILDRIHSTSLMQSVAEVITAFRRAREKMLQARKNIQDDI